MSVTSSLEQPSGFRKVRVATVSEHRGAELETTYGLADGVEGSLDQFEYVSAGDADLSMRGAIVEGTRVGRMQRRPGHIVFWLGDGTASVTPESAETLTAIPGQPLLLSSSVVYDFTADARKISMLHVSERLARERLVDRGIYPRGPVVFGERHADVGALRRLREELRRSAPALVDASVDGAERAALNARVADAVIDTFRVNATPIRALTPVTLAVDLMQREARTPLSLDDLVEASGLSKRGLQSAFIRTYGTSPTQYLRGLRLDGARRDLEDDAATNVADVALAWQFNHLGRFARTYADRFGERPSETLRRKHR